MRALPAFAPSFCSGLTGGGAGLLAVQGFSSVAMGLMLGGAALSCGAYIMATRRIGAGIDGTTEAAALAVLALAALAGMGWLTLAAAAGSVVMLALSEKTRLHALVRSVGETELHAALQFTVLAVVVLPLLPSGPMFGPLEIRPRALWSVVLLFSALNFAGYLARRAVGLQARIWHHRRARRPDLVDRGDAQLLPTERDRSRESVFRWRGESLPPARCSCPACSSSAHSSTHPSPRRSRLSCSRNSSLASALCCLRGGTTPNPRPHIRATRKVRYASRMR